MPGTRGRIADALIVIVAIAASVLPGCRPPIEQPTVVRPVRAVRIGDATVIEGRVFPGRAKATREVDLSFRVAGPLIARPINVGDSVVAGQELATIDPRDFEVRLRNTSAQLEQSRAASRKATEEYVRAQAAYDRDAVSEIELLRVREQSEAAKARVDQLVAAVEADDDALEYTHLRAPFEGTIVAIYVENFEDVREKQVIVRLLDDTRIEMVVDIPEQLISLAPYVEEINCRFDAFPDLELAAEIKEIGTEASDVTRTYPITLIMEQPEGIRILPGMTGEARGRAGRPDVAGPDDGGFELPPSAILSIDGSRSAVWVVDEASGTVRRTEVTLGRTTARGILVDGLEAGQLVATAGVHYLQEGQQVRVMDTFARDDEGATP